MTILALGIVGSLVIGAVMMSVTRDDGAMVHSSATAPQLVTSKPSYHLPGMPVLGEMER